MSDVMIEARGLGKKYGPSVALRDADFELHRGEILGLLGPNGAGKSTTMKILTCFIAPTSGTARVNNCDIWEDPIGVRSAIGYLPESTPLYEEMLVLEYLEWAAAMRGLRGDDAKRRVLTVVEQVRLDDVIAKAIRELSKGFRQRVGLAQALVHEPPILILDEPLSGLDPNQAAEVRQLIKEIGEERTIILSTHNLREVQLTCQRVLIIDRGQIVADDTPQALAQSGGGARYQVTVQLDTPANGQSQRATELFAGLSGVESVSAQAGAPEGELRLELIADTEDDLRASIFQAAVSGELTLLGFSRSQADLERVFRQLTTSSASDAASEPAQPAGDTATSSDADPSDAGASDADADDADDGDANADEE